MDIKQEIFKRLDVLADKLGVAAGHLWAVLVRQALATAVADLVIVFLSAIGLVIAIKVFLYGWKMGMEDDWDDGSNFFLSLCGGIGTVLALMGVFSYLYEGIMYLVNPEYFALQQILNLFK